MASTTTTTTIDTVPLSCETAAAELGAAMGTIFWAFGLTYCAAYFEVAGVFALAGAILLHLWPLTLSLTLLPRRPPTRQRVQIKVKGKAKAKINATETQKKTGNNAKVEERENVVVIRRRADWPLVLEEKQRNEQEKSQEADGRRSAAVLEEARGISSTPESGLFAASEQKPSRWRPMASSLNEAALFATRTLLPFCTMPLWMSGEEEEFSFSGVAPRSFEPETADIPAPVAPVPLSTTSISHRWWRVTVGNQAAALVAIALGNLIAIGVGWLLSKKKVNDVVYHSIYNS